MTEAEGEAMPDRLPFVAARMPRDFLDEVEGELRAAQDGFIRDRERIASLEELRAISQSTQTTLKRSITVLDVVRSAPNATDRARRLRLIRTLRSTR